MDKGRLPGHCAFCGERTHDIRGVWTGAHVLSGEPNALGDPVEGTVQVTLVLTSGKRAGVLLCGPCSEVIGEPENLRTLWVNVSKRFAFEHHNRSRLGGRPLNASQTAYAEAQLIETIHDVPLGVIVRQ